MSRVHPLLFVLCSVLAGCAPNTHTDTNPDRTIGRWQNRHAGDQNLVAVWIQQLPDNSFDAPRYEGKHPCMVAYIFRSGRQHLFHYLPDGTIESEAWVPTERWQLESLAVVYDREAIVALQKRLAARPQNT
jgi:hypothetical protein